MKLNIPQAENHKGQNGKVLVVGGSKLFHAASLWSAQTAAHLVDMVFYASVSQNNEIVKESKKKFFDGIVIGRKQLLGYAAEADVILLGPGLERGKENKKRLEEILQNGEELTETEWENESYLITNYILAKFPQKKFVLDAGALQMLDLDYLPNNCILTPHQLEMKLLDEKVKTEKQKKQLEIVVLVKKGRIDEVWQNNQCQVKISGGNTGLTKGGSGDVLAGLIAGLFCYNEPLVAAAYGSKVLKQTGDDLFIKRGPFFTTTQLVAQIPQTMWKILQTEEKERR